MTETEFVMTYGPAMIRENASRIARMTADLSALLAAERADADREIAEWRELWNGNQAVANETKRADDAEKRLAEAEKNLSFSHNVAKELIAKAQDAEKRATDAEERDKNALSVIEILVGECSRTGTLSLSTMECARRFLSGGVLPGDGEAS